MRKLELQEALAFELTDRNIDNFLEYRATVAAGLQNPTFEDRLHWLEILNVGVIVKDRHAVVSCRISGEPFIFNIDSPTGTFGFYN